MLAAWNLLLNVFENPCRAHAAAHTHSHDAVASIAAFEFTDDASRELCAGAAQRVSEGDRAAVGIDLVRVQATFFDDRQRLRGEGFVEFEDVDVVELESGHLESLRNGEHRAESHLFGLVACGGESDVARE